jgi:hypothetical protein
MYLRDKYPSLCPIKYTTLPTVLKQNTPMVLKYDAQDTNTEVERDYKHEES